MTGLLLPLAAGLTGLEVSLAFAGGIVGVIAAAVIMKLLERAKRQRVSKELEVDRKAAEVEAASIIAEAKAKAESEFIRRREQFDGDTKTARQELRSEEKRLSKREDLIDQKLETLNSKERTLEAAQNAIHEKEKALAGKDRQLNELIGRQKSQLLKVANLSMDEARSLLMADVEKEMEKETAQLITRRLEEAKETADSQSRDVVITAIQRYAAEHTCEGRVIGREGRNIRAFEKATGVDVIVDDTPGVVVVSAFDPVRRETARRALEKLIQDGRIHPTRIEEVVAATEKEVGKQIYAQGKQAMVDANIRGLHNKLIDLLGRLQYRTSYGQNVLQHSTEVAYLAQVIADELGLNGQLARRCGLLHDIGKAIDHEVEGGHPQIGADLCKRYNEKPEVINAVAGHHGDVGAQTVYTPIIAAADAISASRPGARRETLERYVQRLQKLEEIASGFEGVRQAYAIQAGREVRVIVDADNVDDRLSGKIARDVARRVEDEMEYPGEVRVTVIREVRCVEYAR